MSRRSISAANVPTAFARTGSERPRYRFRLQRDGKPLRLATLKIGGAVINTAERSSPACAA